MSSNSPYKSRYCVFTYLACVFGAYKFIIFIHFLCLVHFIWPDFDFEFHFAIDIILHAFIVVVSKSQFFFHNPLYFGYKCVTAIDVLSIKNIKLNYAF